MVMAGDSDNILLLEEVFQLLSETLTYSPFSQSNDSPTKNHLIRFKQLLDPEFSFWLAQTGCLFFAVLMAAKFHVDSMSRLPTPEIAHAKKIYNQLLLTSQLAMSVGFRAQRTTESLLQLKALLFSTEIVVEEIQSVVEAALLQLQIHMCNLIVR